MAVTTRKKKSPTTALNDSISQYESAQNQTSAKKSRTKKDDDDDEWIDESINNQDDLDSDDELSVGSNESDECRLLNNGDIDDDEEEADEEMEGDDDDELLNSIMLKMKKRSTNSSFLQNKSQPSISMTATCLHSMAVSAGLIRQYDNKKSSPLSIGSSSLKKSEEDDDTHMARITLRMASRSVRSGSTIMNSLQGLSVEDVKSSVTTSPHDESTNLAVKCGFLVGTTTIQFTKAGLSFTFQDGAHIKVCKKAIVHAIEKGYVNANEVDLSHAFPQEDVTRAVQYGLSQKPDGTKFSINSLAGSCQTPCIWNLRNGVSYDSIHKCCNQESIPIASITEPWFAARLERARQKGFSEGWTLTIGKKSKKTINGDYDNFRVWSPTGTKYTSMKKARAADVNFGRLTAEGKYTVFLLLLGQQLTSHAQNNTTEKMTKKALRKSWRNMSRKDLKAEITRIHRHFKTEIKPVENDDAGKKGKESILNKLEGPHGWLVEYPRSFLSLPQEGEEEEQQQQQQQQEEEDLPLDAAASIDAAVLSEEVNSNDIAAVATTDCTSTLVNPSSESTCPHCPYVRGSRRTQECKRHAKGAKGSNSGGCCSRHGCSGCTWWLGSTICVEITSNPPAAVLSEETKATRSLSQKKTKTTKKKTKPVKKKETKPTKKKKVSSSLGCPHCPYVRGSRRTQECKRHAEGKRESKSGGCCSRHGCSGCTWWL